jgi:site-specific recombinase XerD
MHRRGKNRLALAGCEKPLEEKPAPREFFPIVPGAFTPRLAEALEELLAAGQSGKALRRRSFWAILKENAKGCGLPTVAPYDLRWILAGLCHQSGGELEQIQFLLGHVSIQTTG